MAEGETPEAVQYDKLVDRAVKHKKLDADGVREVMNTTDQTVTADPFRISDVTAKRLGINLQTQTYTWVRDPKIWAEAEMGSRIDEMQDNYEDAKPVYQPGAQTLVRRRDTILVTLPIKYKHQMDKWHQERMENEILMNPAIASQNGTMRPEDVLEIIESRGSEELVSARSYGMFDKHNPAHLAAVAARERMNWGASRTQAQSDTFNQPYETAYRRKIDAIMMSNPRMTMKEAEKAHAEDVRRMETSAWMGARQDSGQEAWGDDMDASERRAGGLYSMGGTSGDLWPGARDSRPSNGRERGRQTTGGRR